MASSVARVRALVSSWSAASRKQGRAFSASSHASKAHNVGILAMETYMSQRYVSQTALEKADGVSAGKYTIGARAPVGRHGTALACRLTRVAAASRRAAGRSWLLIARPHGPPRRSSRR
jgi:hypothetical protein